MGIGVSGWPLARAVSLAGQLGTVSGTVLDIVHARRLQDGDAGGHMRRALENFPYPEVARRVLDRYFIEGGRAPGTPYKAIPQFSVNARPELQELAVVSHFAEVWLAKEGHQGPVAINYMEKLRIANLPGMYGAVLAGVDYVAIGAGIPREVPGILDSFARGEAVRQRLDVEGAGAEDDFTIGFDPRAVLGPTEPRPRPRFLAIVASTVLATSLARKSTGKIDGFVIEGPTAGGHNAPPRGEMRLDEKGEPIYGPRDEVDFEKIKELGIPFWLAGGYGRPGQLDAALALGARGVQTGTPFALTEESSLRESLKLAITAAVTRGDARVYTKPDASPTGFPFKVVGLEGTLSEESVYEARERICDLGYLRQAYKKENGSVGWRCSAEPVDIFVSKGGSAEEAAGRTCLCNGLISNIGLPQVRKDGYVEPPVVTMGDDLDSIKPVLPSGGGLYRAADYINHLLGNRS